MATYSSIRYNMTLSSSTTGGGSLKLISTFTSDGSDATATFASGIDSTYKEYIFKFIDIHSQTNEVVLTMNGSTDSGSNYNVTKTTTYYESWHSESGSASGVSYSTSRDMAQNTGFCDLQSEYGTDNDQAGCGTLHLFNPSSTTFTKNFIFTGNQYHQNDYTQQTRVSGYFNTASAVDAIQFKMSSGEIQGGVIKMYGVS